MLNVSSRRDKIVAGLLIAVILINLLSVVGSALATACGDYDCVDQSEFATDDPDHDGWVASNNSDVPGGVFNTTFGWLDHKNFGMLWWATAADGVLTAEGDKVGLYKTIFLYPGIYRIVMRAAADKKFGLFSVSLTPNGTPAGGTTYGLGSWSLTDSFQTYTSDEFTVHAAGDVTFELDGDEGRQKYYFDYIWIVQNTTATPTPGAGTPTVTPIASTATPIPTGTPYCVSSSPTATPGPPQFQLTQTPTPTPDPLINWTVLDRFDFVSFSNIWTVAGSGVYVSLSTGRASSVPGAAFIPYSVPPGGWTHVDMERKALIWEPDTVLTGTVYADGWGRADLVPQGESSYLELWTLDGGTLLWSQAITVQVSALNWYNYHASLTSAGGIAAIAFLSSRTDGAVTGGVYVDDVYFYGDLANSPLCDGTYINPVGGGGTAPTGTRMEFPGDKPCPPDLKVPNNFWGTLLANLTLFFDGIFAFTPLHAQLGLSERIGDLISSPIVIYLQLLALFFDLRIPLAVLGVIVLINVGITIYDTWIKVKDAIPFL